MKDEGCDVKHVSCFKAPGVLLIFYIQNLYLRGDIATNRRFFWDARIDLGKIYNATDIEIYFGWRAQVRIDSIDSLSRQIQQFRIEK